MSVLAATGCGEPRPAHWAERLRGPGLRNLHRVDAGLYRSARLNRRMVAEFKRLGITTVIDLRGGDGDRQLLAGSCLILVSQPCRADEISEEELIRFLRVAIDPARRPVLVHCWAGADRTGVMVAAYRVAARNWSREEAVREMRKGGYHHHGWRFPNLARLIMQLDVKALRRKAGIHPHPGRELKEAG